MSFNNKNIILRKLQSWHPRSSCELASRTGSVGDSDCLTADIFQSSTGSTGYIGGDALHALYTAHPEYEYTAIVRNSDKGALVAAAYPKVRLVYGTLDDATLLEEESAKADIVLRKIVPARTIHNITC